jgi:hypothetical protein
MVTRGPDSLGVRFAVLCRCAEVSAQREGNFRVEQETDESTCAPGTIFRDRSGTLPC